MSTQATADTAPKDPVADYLAEVESIANADTTGYVDPYVSDRGASKDFARAEDERQTDDAEDEGPSDADIERGERVPESNDDLPDDLPDEGDDDVDPANEDETPTEAADKKGKQFRIRPADEIEALALKMRKSNPQLKLSTALAEAERILNIKTEEPAAEQTPAEDALPDPAEIQAEIATLEKQWRKAVKDLEDDEVTEAIEAKIDAAKEKLPKAIEAVESRKTAEVSAYEAAATEAAALYPDAAVEGSDLFKMMEAIHAQMERTGDPTVNDPKKPIIIAQMAAKELRIAPKVAKTPGVNPAVAKKSSRGPASMTAPLANTRASTAPRTSNIDEAISKINSAEDYEALMSTIARR